MKIRQGFVSNSSSSSFTLVGYLVDTDQYESDLDELYDEVDAIASEHDFDVLYGSDDGLSNGQIAVGRLYTSSSDDPGPTAILNVEKLVRWARKEIPEYLKVKEDEVKLITGIRWS